MYVVTAIANPSGCYVLNTDTGGVFKYGNRTVREYLNEGHQIVGAFIGKKSVYYQPQEQLVDFEKFTVWGDMILCNAICFGHCKVTFEVDKKEQRRDVICNVYFSRTNSLPLRAYVVGIDRECFNLYFPKLGIYTKAYHGYLLRGSGITTVRRGVEEAFGMRGLDVTFQMWKCEPDY